MSFILINQQPVFIFIVVLFSVALWCQLDRKLLIHLQGLITTDLILIKISLQLKKLLLRISTTISVHILFRKLIEMLKFTLRNFTLFLYQTVYLYEDLISLIVVSAVLDSKLVSLCFLWLAKSWVIQTDYLQLLEYNLAFCWNMNCVNFLFEVIVPLCSLSGF